MRTSQDSIFISENLNPESNICRKSTMLAEYELQKLQYALNTAFDHMALILSITEPSNDIQLN